MLCRKTEALSKGHAVKSSKLLLQFVKNVLKTKFAKLSSYYLLTSVMLGFQIPNLMRCSRTESN